MKAVMVKKTPDNSDSDSDSEWFARFAEGLSTSMHKSRRISSHSSRSSDGTGHRERASGRGPRELSGRGGHAGGGLRQDSRSSSRREPSRKRDCETGGSETVTHQTLSSDFWKEREVGTISISSLSKYSEKRKFSSDSNNETNSRNSGDAVIWTSLKRAKVVDTAFPEGSTDVIPAAGNRKLTSHSEESCKHRTSPEMIVNRLAKTKSTSPAATHAKETKKRRISSHPTCDLCSRKFTKIKDRDFHLDHHDEMMYRCPRPCGHEFILFKRLQQHSRDNHSFNLTTTNREKCKIRGRKTRGESNESDSQKSWTSLKKTKKDFRQKRKVIAVSTVRKQCKLNKKSADKNQIQKKQVARDVNEGASESNGTAEQCFSLKTVKKEDEEKCGMSKRCPFKHCSFYFDNDLRLGQHIREKHTSQLKINRSASFTLFNQGQHLKGVKVEIQEPSMQKKPMSSFQQEDNATKSNIDQGRTTIEQPMNIIKPVSYNNKSTSESVEASSDNESANMTAMDDTVPTVDTSITNERLVTVQRGLVTESPTKQHETTNETINETVNTKLLAMNSNDGSSVDKNDIFEASSTVDSTVRNKTEIVGKGRVTGTESPADIATALKTTANTGTMDRSTEYSASLELLLDDFVGDETDEGPIQPFIDYSLFMKIRESSTVQSSVEDDKKRELDPPVPHDKMCAQPSPFLAGQKDAMPKKSVPMNAAPSVAGAENIELISYDKTSDEPTEEDKTTVSPSTSYNIPTLDQTGNITEIPPISDSTTIQYSRETGPFFDMWALSMVAKMPTIDTLKTPAIREEERLEHTVSTNVALEPSEQKICWVHSPDCTEEQAITIEEPTVELSTWNTEPRLSDNSTAINQRANLDPEMNTTMKNSFPTIDHSVNKRTSVEPPADIIEETNMRTNITTTESSENSLSPKDSYNRDNRAMGLSATTTLIQVPSNRSKLTGMHTHGHTPSETYLQKTTLEATGYLTSVLLEHSYFRPGMNEGEHQDTMSLIRRKTLTNVNGCGKDKSKLSTGTVDLNSLSVQGVSQDPQAKAEVNPEPLIIDMQTIKSEPSDNGDWHFRQRDVDRESFQWAINESFLTGEELFVERLSEKFLRWTIKDVAKEALKELRKKKRLTEAKNGKQTEKTNGSVNQTLSKINIKQERNDEDLVSSPSSDPSPAGKSVIERKPRSRLSLRSGTKVNTKDKKMRMDVQKGVKYSAIDQDGFEKVVSPVRVFSASHPCSSSSPGNENIGSSQTLLPESAVQPESANDKSSPLTSPSSPSARKRLLMSCHGVERSVSPSSSMSTPSPSVLSSSFSHSQDKTVQYDISSSSLLSSPLKLSQMVSSEERTEKPFKQSETSDNKRAETDRTLELFPVASTRSSLPSPFLTTQGSGSTTTTCSSSDETTPGSTPAPPEMSSVNRRKSIHVSPPPCLSSPRHSSSSVETLTASTSRSSPNTVAAPIDMPLSGILATLSTKLPAGQREVNGKLKLTLSLKQSSPIKLQYNLRDESYSPWSLLQNTHSSHSYMSSLPHQNCLPWESLLSDTDVLESQNTPFGKKAKSTKVAYAKSATCTNVTEDDRAIDDTDEYLCALLLAVFSKMDREKKSLAKIEIMKILHNLQYETSIPHVGRGKNHCSISGSSTAAENTGSADILNQRNIPCVDAGNGDTIFFRCMVIPVLNELGEEKKSLAQLEMYKLIHAVRFDIR